MNEQGQDRPRPRNVIHLDGMFAVELAAEQLSAAIADALDKGVEVVAIRQDLHEVLSRHGLQCLTADEESLDSQVDRLAKFIMAEVPGEPSENQGAVDTAIRVLRKALGLRAPKVGP